MMKEVSVEEASCEGGGCGAARDGCFSSTLLRMTLAPQVAGVFTVLILI
jgi:hypothetical protein